MGLDIYLYAECRFKGRWISINPLVESPFDGALLMRPVFQGRRDAFESIEDARVRALKEKDFETLSPRIKEVLIEGLNEEEAREAISDGCYMLYDFEIIEKKLKGSSPEEPLYKGYALKKYITQFEKGLIDDIPYSLTPEEFCSLSESKKKYYRFYSWDEWWSPYGYFRSIVQAVSDQYAYFCDAVPTDHWAETNYEELQEARKSIRLIAKISC